VDLVPNRRGDLDAARLHGGEAGRAIPVFFAIGQVPTGIFVLGLVTFNVVMASHQELKARASVEALAQLQVPHARVRRGGDVDEVESTQLVPGDIVLLEAGDVAPADGRIVTSATLELQEAALTLRAPRRARARPKADVCLRAAAVLLFATSEAGGIPGPSLDTTS
jgi:Ca2+-transporting ATPase